MDYFSPRLKLYVDARRKCLEKKIFLPDGTNLSRKQFRTFLNTEAFKLFQMIPIGFMFVYVFSYVKRPELAHEFMGNRSKLLALHSPVP